MDCARVRSPTQRLERLVSSVGYAHNVYPRGRAEIVGNAPIAAHFDLGAPEYCRPGPKHVCIEQVDCAASLEEILLAQFAWTPPTTLLAPTGNTPGVTLALKHGEVLAADG